MEDTKKLKGEQKDLRRVFDNLSNFLAKKRVSKALEPLRERLSLLNVHKKTPESVKVMTADNTAMTEEMVEEEATGLAAKIEKLDSEMTDLLTKPGKVISAEDLNEALAELGKKHSRKEIEDMIWEVDENLDGCVDWEEFQRMYKRNIEDKTGLEPFQLFNVVQFLMYDKDSSGQVSIDETMTMLFQRYGKERLESQMKILFGEDLKTTDGDGELSFAEYLKAVSVRMPRKPKGGKKKKKN